MLVVVSSSARLQTRATLSAPAVTCSAARGNATHIKDDDRYAVERLAEGLVGEAQCRSKGYRPRNLELGRDGHC